MLACTINAACLALINAGIPMKFTIAAVNCMIQEGTNNIILDPDSTQLQVWLYQYIFTYLRDKLIKKRFKTNKTFQSINLSIFIKSVSGC